MKSSNDSHKNALAVENERELRRMGIAWFVLRSYWAYVNPKERRWENTKTLLVRECAFRRTFNVLARNGEKLHKLYLEYIIENANPALINHNRLGVSADEVRKLAKEILSTNPGLKLVVSKDEL